MINCKMCNNSVRDLKNSHVISDFIWKSSPNFIFINRDLQELDFLPFTEKLFCEKCESLIGDYEKKFKEAFFSLTSPFVFSTAKKGHDLSYLINGFSEKDLNIVISSFLLRATLAKTAFGAEYELQQENIESIKKNILNHKFSSEIKIKKIFNSINILGSREDNKAIIIRNYHQLKNNYLSSSFYQDNGTFIPPKISMNPIWKIQLLNMTFIIEEVVPRFCYNQLENLPSLTKGESIRVNLIEGKGIIKIDMLNPNYIVTNWKYKTFKQVFKENKKCFICGLGTNDNNYCCYENIFGKHTYWVFTMEKNGIFINRLPNFSLVRGKYEKKIAGKYIFYVPKKSEAIIFQSKGILNNNFISNNTVIAIKKSSCLIDEISSIKQLLKVIKPKK